MHHLKTLTYDLNGNLLSDGEKYSYAFDAFNRLVAIYNYSSSGGSPTYRGTLIARYWYNAFGQRIGEQTDTNDCDASGSPDGNVDTCDPLRHIVIDPQGRRVATFEGDYESGSYLETFVHHRAELMGPAFAGGPLVRDRTIWVYSPGKDGGSWSPVAERRYYCSDFRGQVSAMVTSDGKLAEQYRYSPSGVPFGIPLGDVNGDGKCEGGSGGADKTQMGTSTTSGMTYLFSSGASNYQVRGDLNLDGQVNASDTAIVTANNGLTLGRGKLSDPAIGSKIVSRNAEWTERGLVSVVKYFYSSELEIALSGASSPTDAVNLVANIAPSSPCHRDTDRSPQGSECARRCNIPGQPYGITPVYRDGRARICCICTGNIDRKYRVPGIIMWQVDALNAIAECVGVHEAVHWNQIGGSDACRECEGYRAELACLEGKYRQFNDDPFYYITLRIRMDFVAGKMEAKCAECDAENAHPGPLIPDTHPGDVSPLGPSPLSPLQ